MKTFHGIFVLDKPVLVVHNIYMIRDVLVKDFNSFVDRNDYNLSKLVDEGESDQLWKKQLPFLTGGDWKDVRSTFYPTFTTGS